MGLRYLHLCVATLLAMAGWAVAPGCGSDEASDAPAETGRSSRVAPPPAQAPRPVAVISVEGFGEIRVELMPEVAPKTVENFIELAEDEYYDGTTFHRVVPGFMIQGGDPNSKNRDPRDDGKGGPGYTIDDEFSQISHTRGMVSMANKNKPRTGGSQFFIVVADRPDLDGGYALFGRVISGMEVADRIVAVDRDLYGRHGPIDRPLENVVIASIRIEHPETAGEPAPPPAVEMPVSPASDWDEGVTES